MGKGSPKPTDQTVVQTNLPEYVQPYFERLLDRTEAETKQQYQPYQGQRLQTGGTDVTDASRWGVILLVKAFKDYLKLKQPPWLDLEDHCKAWVIKLVSLIMQQPNNICLLTCNRWWMFKNQAILDAQRQNAGRAAEAVQAGAFGGSRQAVQQGLAGEALSRQLGEIQASGQQQAYESAQGQFERDRAARESAERLGLGAAESASGQAAQIAQLGQMAREGISKPLPC